MEEVSGMPPPPTWQINWDDVCSDPPRAWMFTENQDYRTSQRNFEAHASRNVRKRGLVGRTRRVGTNKVWLLVFDSEVGPPEWFTESRQAEAWYRRQLSSEETTKGTPDGTEGGPVGDEGSNIVWLGEQDA